MSVRRMRIALVGATGVVGSAMREQLALRLGMDYDFLPVASSRSVGREVSLGGRPHRLESLDRALAWRPDLVLMAVGADLAREWAPRFQAQGAWVIDNSSAFRMDPTVPLVVPEVNPETLPQEPGIVANPNCSTIQLVVILAPIAQCWGLEHVHVATYQSVSGSGMRGLSQLAAEREQQGAAPVREAMRGPRSRLEPLELSPKTSAEAAYAYPIDMNCIPQCDGFAPDGYTHEERKLMRESARILGLDQLRISATAVRVPVVGGHSEAVSVVCRRPVSSAMVRERLQAAEGVLVVDDPERLRYPMPLYAHGRDQVMVGRIREDLAFPGRGINLWIVADNIRKGAATNAVQIAQLLTQRLTD